jgi:Fe-S oxidoreductase
MQGTRCRTVSICCHPLRTPRATKGIEDRADPPLSPGVLEVPPLRRMLLLAHSYFLRADPKQHARMKPYPPLATLLAGALLRDRGHDVRLFDAMLADGVDAFRAELAVCRPALVGILEDNFNFLTKMCTLRMREATLEMVAVARAHGARVVVNGSDSADHAGQYFDAGADAVIFGEAELTMLEIADRLRTSPGASLEGIAGTATRDASGDVIRSSSRAPMRELDRLPLPAWDMVDVEAYRAVWTNAHGRFSWNIVSSRGCPFGATGARSRSSVDATPSARPSVSPRRCGA